MTNYNSLPNLEKQAQRCEELYQYDYCYRMDDKFERELEETLAMFDALLIENSDEFSNDGSLDLSEVTDAIYQHGACHDLNSSHSTEKIRPNSFLHDEMSEFNNVFTQLSSSKFTSATLTSINPNKQDLNTYFIPSSLENLPRTSQKSQYISFNNNKNDKKETLKNKNNISDKNNNNDDSKDLNNIKSGSKGLKKDPMCSNCLRLKRFSCAEILRSFYFESLTSLHNYHSHDQHKNSSLGNYLNIAKTHSSNNKAYSTLNRDMRINKQQEHLDTKFHTIGHSKRLLSNCCIVCNEPLKTKIDCKDQSFKNYRSNNELLSDSSGDEDDFLVIREPNDGYNDGTLKKTSNQEISLELAKFPNKEDFDSAYQTGEKLTDKDNVNFKDLSYTQDTMERFNKNRIGLRIELDTKQKIYHGSMRVHMNIKQAISIHNQTANHALKTSPANMAYIDADVEESIENIPLKKENKNNNNDTFRLPSETSKVIHISSESNTALVIQMLLDKFNIGNPCHNFALFVRTYDYPVNLHGEFEGNLNDEHLNIHLQHNKLQKQHASKLPQQHNFEPSQPYHEKSQQVQHKQENPHKQLQHTPSTCHMRKLHAEEYPLKTLIDCFLTAGHDGLDRCQFVLQDYSSGEIIWEAFSTHELQNFLLILKKEEECKRKEIVHKYNELRRAFERLMSHESSDR